MASPPKLPPSLLNTLRYFARYDYPLTATELWYWQHGTRFSESEIKKLITRTARSSNRNYKSPLRRRRERYSRAKWIIAKEVGESLKRISTVSAVFITGALAMNNCPEDDDIDLMIVTRPNCLWPTRFFVNLFLFRLRRYPGQTSAPDKICLNLWLDTDHLHITPHNLYYAHEILQTKVLLDKYEIYSRFLHTNSWVKKYLPIAYTSQIKGLGQPEIRPIRPISWYFLWPLNLIFFIGQYLYMKPKMTAEKISLGSAFFHPLSPSPS